MHTRRSVFRPFCCSVCLSVCLSVHMREGQQIYVFTFDVAESNPPHGALIFLSYGGMYAAANHRNPSVCPDGASHGGGKALSVGSKRGGSHSVSQSVSLYVGACAGLCVRPSKPKNQKPGNWSPPSLPSVFVHSGLHAHLGFSREGSRRAS